MKTEKTTQAATGILTITDIVKYLHSVQLKHMDIPTTISTDPQAGIVDFIREDLIGKDKDYRVTFFFVCDERTADYSDNRLDQDEKMTQVEGMVDRMV